MSPIIPEPSTYLVEHVAIAADSDGANTIISAVPGKRIRVLSYAITASAAGTVTFQNTEQTPEVYATFELAANGGVSHPGGIYAPAFETAKGTGLAISNDTDVDTYGHLTYQIVA